MATQVTTVLTAGMTAAEPVTGQMKRRSISPEAGRALVILGHAIEYLTDEFVHEGGSFSANRGQIDAIQLLIALNRQIYLACPEAPTLRQWLQLLLRRPVKESELERNWLQG